MKKQIHKFLIPLFGIILILAIILSWNKLNEIYNVIKFCDYQEYISYTTENGEYTISLRDISEAGLNGAMRLNIYLVNNDNGQIKYIDRKRLDYYEDFTPYVSFEEHVDGVSIIFHTKHSNDKLEVYCSS